MGIFSRLTKIVSGAGGAIQAPFGMVKDLVTAPFADDEYDGFLPTLWGVTTDRAGQIVENTMGRDEGIGALIGAIPDEIRDTVKSRAGDALVGGLAGAGAGAAFLGVGAIPGFVAGATAGAAYGQLRGGDGLVGDVETLYREGVAEPISTALTVASLGQAQGDDIGGFFKGRNWRDAYKIAQSRSPGQALALAFGTTDIENERQVQRAVNSDWFKPVSGTTDAVLRLSTLDPANLGLGAMSAFGKGKRLITNKTDIAKLSRAPEVQRFIKSTEGMSAAEIRHQFFPRHQFGAPISTLLAEAGDAETKTQVMRALMGDRDELVRIGEQRAALAEQIRTTLTGAEDASETLRWTEQMLRENGHLDLANKIAVRAKDREAVAERLRNELYPEQDRLARLESAAASMREVPTPTVTDALRSRVTRSATYQKNVLTKPLHVVFDMQPHKVINLHDPRSDIQVHRMLQKSDLPLEVQDAYRTRYMAATNPTERLTILQEAEDAAIRSMLPEGMDRADVDKVLNSRAQSRSRTNALLEARVYDGGGRSRVKIDDEGGYIEVPLYASQESNLTAVADLDAVRDAARLLHGQVSKSPSAKAAAALASLKTSRPAVMTEEVLEAFHKAWRPAVLLTGRWPQRILTEGQLRVMAKLGALAPLKAAATGVRNIVSDRVHGVPKEARLPGARGFEVLSYQMEGAFGAPGDTANLFKDLASARSSFDTLIGQEERAMYNRLVSYAMGEELVDEPLKIGDRVRAADRDNVGTIRMIDELAGRATVHFRNRADRTEATVDLALDELTPLTASKQKAVPKGTVPTGAWAHLDPRDDFESWAIAWERDVNLQMGQDPMTRKLLAGESVEDVVDWLRRDPAGVEYRRARPKVRTRNVERWVEDVADQVERYTLGDPEIKAAALKKRASAKDVMKKHPNLADLPVVHGEILKQALGTSLVSQTVNGFVEKSFYALGTWPIDKLLRHPFFDAMYQAEATRQIELLHAQAARRGGRLSVAELDRVSESARQFALAQTNDVLYDMAERSQLADMLRFVSPFYAAWQEVMTVWAGLMVDNPAFVNRMRVATQAPERAGMVVDENGNQIDEDGRARDWQGNYVKAGSERYIQIRLPDFAQDIPGLKHVGEITFNKKSVNLLLQGTPGVGPIVQIPLNEIVKGRPGLAESLEFALPYGTNESIPDIVFPTTVKSLWSAAEGEEDKSFRNAKFAIYRDMTVDYELGKRDTAPTWAEAEKKAQEFWKIRTVAKWGLPASPTFRSPYQLQIDAWRQRLALDETLDKTAPGYQTPEEWFLSEFGPEFFALTQSFTRSVDGIRATVEAAEARNKYRPLIEKYPELGGLIVGSEGAGEWSATVYQAQLAKAVSPESDQTQRERVSKEEFASGPGERLGWLKYRQVNDLLDSIRVARGLPNLQVAAAADLAAAKSVAVSRIAEEHPEWWASFNKRDDLAFSRRLEGMREIAADPVLSQRPEIEGLAKYLQARDAVQQLLAARRAKTLTAASNQDVAVMWETVKSALVEENLAFADVFYRWLDRDTLKVA